MDIIIWGTVALVVLVVACVLACALTEAVSRPASPPPIVLGAPMPPPIELEVVVDDFTWTLVARRLHGSGWWSLQPNPWRVTAELADGRVVIYGQGTWTYDFRLRPHIVVASGPLWGEPRSISGLAEGSSMLGVLSTRKALR